LGPHTQAKGWILHPNRRITYIRANWKAKWQKPVLKKVNELWESYRERNPSRPAYFHERRSIPSARDQDDYDQIAQDLRKYTRPASQDEYEDYSNGEPYDIGKISALEWWCQDQQRKRWPIPAMSDEPERVFSGARRTISWERAQLGAENIERVECLKHWLRSGIVKEELEAQDELL
jgi:hAT family protein